VSDELSKSVYDAVASRYSCRAFLDKAVDPDILSRVLTAALRTPSGGNVQPWHMYLVRGGAMGRLKTLMAETVMARPEGDAPDYDIYPPSLKEPYRSRRFAVGEDLYGALGIARENKIGRLMWLSKNFQFFDAPVGLFCLVDRSMGPPQWSDLGMVLQTIMLLLQEEGLASCAQEAWSRYGKTVTDFLGAPPDQMLFCGMAIGYGDDKAEANSFRAQRASLDDVLVTLSD